MSTAVRDPFKVCVWLVGFLHTYVLYTSVYAGTCWEYMDPGWMWRHGDAAALPLLVYWVWHPLTGLIKLHLISLIIMNVEKILEKSIFVYCQTLGEFRYFPKHDLFS